MSLLMMNDIQQRNAAKRERLAARRVRWQEATSGFEKENVSNLEVEVLADSYRNSQMNFFVGLFDESLPLGAFVSNSMLIDDYIVAMAFDYLIRANIDLHLWSEQVVLAIALAIEMSEDVWDYGSIEVIKFWVETHGGLVTEERPHHYVIDGEHVIQFHRAKHVLWHRLDFRLFLDAHTVKSTLSHLKMYYSRTAVFPVRSKAYLQYLYELREKQAMRLWVDHRMSRRSAPRPVQQPMAPRAKRKSVALSATRGHDEPQPPHVQPMAPPAQKSSVQNAVRCSPTHSDSSSSTSSSFSSEPRSKKKRHSLDCDEALDDSSDLAMMVSSDEAKAWDSCFAGAYAEDANAHNAGSRFLSHFFSYFGNTSNNK